ncbi:MAG: sialidase family protein, partial [Luteolibacter sp.]
MKGRCMIVSALMVALHLMSCRSPDRVEAETSQGDWFSSRIGGGGYVIDLIPTSDPAIYYSHTDVGGFYRSDDGGENWRMLQGALPATQGSQEPRSMVVHPKDPNTILVATGSHWDKNREGIYRSTDGGKTFERTLEAAFAGNGSTRMWGNVLAIDPFDPNGVLAGSMKDGVFRSE